MWRAVVLSVFIAVVVATDDDFMGKCRSAFEPATVHCCTTPIVDPDISPELKECFALPHSPQSCEVEECVAKKIGYYESDGSINKEIFKSFLEKKIDDKKLLAIVEEKCVNYDISKHGPANLCMYKKMRHCLYNQFLMYCPGWKSDGECSEAKKFAEECTIKY